MPVPTTNLERWFRFLEGSGTSVADSATPGHGAGTLTNSPAWVGGGGVTLVANSSQSISAAAYDMGTARTWASLITLDSWPASGQKFALQNKRGGVVSEYAQYINDDGTVSAIGFDFVQGLAFNITGTVPIMTGVETLVTVTASNASTKIMS